MSEEKVLTLRGKKAVWAPGGGSGPIDPKRLPEGYPYKEQSETEVVVLAETAVSLSETQGIGMGTLTPSDYVPLVAGQKYFVTWNGVRYETVATTTPTNLVTLAAETENGIVAITAIAAQSMYGIEAGPGLYVGDGTDTLSISTIGITETIHKMAEEFLPAGVGGGGLVFEITESDYTNDTSNYTVTKNYDPIYEQLEKGGSVVIKLHDTTGIVFIVPQMSMVLAGQGFAIISRGTQSNMTLVFTTGSYH